MFYYKNKQQHIHEMNTNILLYIPFPVADTSILMVGVLIQMMRPLTSSIKGNEIKIQGKWGIGVREVR